jgi:hypothetical protein
VPAAGRGVRAPVDRGSARVSFLRAGRPGQTRESMSCVTETAGRKEQTTLLNSSR